MGTIKPFFLIHQEEFEFQRLNTLADLYFQMTSKLCHFKAGETIGVRFSDPFLFVLSVIAFYKYGISAVYLEGYHPFQKSNDEDVCIDKIIADHRLDGEKFTGSVISRSQFNIMLTEGQITTAPESTETSVFHVYQKDSDGNYLLSLDHQTLHSAFGVLDQDLIRTDSPNVFLLFSDLSVAEKVVNILWCYTRGISCIMRNSREVHLSEWTMGDRGKAMDFGIFFFGGDATLSRGGDAYRLLKESARFADKNGFSAVWTPERHFNQFGGLFPNPALTSTAVAMITDRVQVRSGSLVSPLHHTARLVEEWSVVDNLSRGRVAISFASGWQCDDFVFCPEHYTDRHQHMFVQIAEFKRLWKGEEVMFTNGLNKQVGVKTFPRPFQEELDIWITASGRTDTFIDAGKIGANILTHLLWQDTSELVSKIAAYRESLKANGFDPESRKVCVMVHTYIGKDMDQVRTMAEKPLKDYISSSIGLIESMSRTNLKDDKATEAIGRYGKTTEKIENDFKEDLLEIAFNRFVNDASLVGTVDTGIRLIEQLQAMDVQEVACLIDFGFPDETVLDGLQRLDILRKHFDGESRKKYGVTHTCLSEAILENLKNDKSLDVFVEQLSAAWMKASATTPGFEINYPVPPKLFSYNMGKTSMVNGLFFDSTAISNHLTESADHRLRQFSSPINEELF